MKLPKEVAEKYKLVNWKGGRRQWFGHRFGWVDVEAMTLNHADRLHQLGFSKLALKPKRKKKKEEVGDEPPVKAKAAPSTITTTKEDCGCGKKK